MPWFSFICLVITETKIDNCGEKKSTKRSTRFQRGRRVTFFNAGHTRLLGMRRDRSVVGRRILRCPNIDTAWLAIMKQEKPQAWTKISQSGTYGATGKSAFLFLMGSDIVIDRFGLKRAEQMELEGLLRTRGEMSKVGGRIWYCSFGGLDYWWD